MGIPVADQLRALNPNMTTAEMLAAIRSRTMTGGAGSAPVQVGNTGQYVNGNGQQLQNAQGYQDYSNNASNTANAAGTLSDGGLNMMGGGSGVFTPQWSPAGVNTGPADVNPMGGPPQNNVNPGIIADIRNTPWQQQPRQQNWWQQVQQNAQPYQQNQQQNQYGFGGQQQYGMQQIPNAWGQQPYGQQQGGLSQIFGQYGGYYPQQQQYSGGQQQNPYSMYGNQSFGSTAGLNSNPYGQNQQSQYGGSPYGQSQYGNSSAYGQQQSQPYQQQQTQSPNFGTANWGSGYGSQQSQAMNGPLSQMRWSGW